MNEWDNPMYRFKDTQIDKNYNPSWIPTSAMYYDGILFEEAIEGYQTLSVEGREMLSVNIESTSIQSGSIITNQTLPSRTLTIKYKLEDNNPEALQEKFNDLMWYLYREKNVSIVFNDELDYTFYGRFNTADTPPGDRNSIVSTFTLYCDDPKKYSKTLRSKGAIVSDFKYPVVPDNIIATVSRDGTLEITNQTLKLSISKEKLSAGDVVEFKIKEGVVLINGMNRTKYLDLNSDFKNFFLKQNDVVKSNNGTVEIQYRKVML